MGDQNTIFNIQPTLDSIKDWQNNGNTDYYVFLTEPEFVDLHIEKLNNIGYSPTIMCLSQGFITLCELTIKRL